LRDDLMVRMRQASIAAGQVTRHPSSTHIFRWLPAFGAFNGMPA